MRPLAALLALAATGGLLAACGSDRGAGAATSSSTHTTTTTAKAKAKGHSNNTPTRAQAIALGRAVNLRSTDVPGFTVAPEHQHETGAEKRLQRKLLLCVGPAGPEQGPGGSSSPSFARRGGILQQGVSSSVNVAASSAAADKQLAELRSQHTRACLQGYLDALFAGPTFKQGHVDHVAITLGVPPSFGTTGSFAWRIAVKFTIHSIQVPFYLDVLGFVYGPTQVMLLSSGLPVPFPAAAEEQLFKLLVARTKAHGV